MAYYRIRTRKRTQHVVKASSKKKALEIADRHGIYYPWGDPDRKYDAVIRETDKWTLMRRRNGVGGRIWFEDSNGRLMYEDPKR